MYNRIMLSDEKLKKIFDGGLEMGAVYGIHFESYSRDEICKIEDLQNFVHNVLPSVFENNAFTTNLIKLKTIIVKWDIMFEMFKKRLKLNKKRNLYDILELHEIDEHATQYMIIVEASYQPSTKRNANLKRRIVEYTLKRLLKTQRTNSFIMVVSYNNLIERKYHVDLRYYKNINYHLVSYVNFGAKLFSLLPLWIENTTIEIIKFVAPNRHVDTKHW